MIPIDFTHWEAQGVACAKISAAIGEGYSSLDPPSSVPVALSHRCLKNNSLDMQLKLI